MIMKYAVSFAGPAILFGSLFMIGGPAEVKTQNLVGYLVFNFGLLVVAKLLLSLMRRVECLRGAPVETAGSGRNQCGGDYPSSDEVGARAQSTASASGTYC